MANTLTFNFESHPVHSVTINNEPWFFAKDVCKALDIDITQIRKLDLDERGLHLIQTLGGEQQVSIVSESGAYALALRCRDAMKPGTRPHRFRKWVTREVLPSIRKTGAYSSSPQQLAKDCLKSLKAFVRFDIDGHQSVTLVDINSVPVNPKDEAQVRGFIHELSDKMYPMIADIILEHYKEVARVYGSRRRPSAKPLHL